MKVGNLEVYGIIYKITNKVNGKVYIGQTAQKMDLKADIRIRVLELNHSKFQKFSI
jgi:hypothetical protein|nr:MAG TPA: intron associated endonuclease [Caudoviricetes sp.]